jgi:hypothetical protein
MGTSQSAVARLESGAHDPQISSVQRYAGALGASIGIAGAPADAQDAAPASPVLDVIGASHAPPDRLPPEQPLTPVQRRILQEIADALQKHGFAPSIRDIGAATGPSSPSAVRYQLGELERKGYIRRDAGRARAIEVLFLPADRCG